MWRCNDVWYGFAFIAPRLGFNLKMNGVFELLWTRPIVGRLCWELEMNGRLAFGFSRWNWCLISAPSADLFWVVADYHLICVFVSYLFSVGFYVGLFLFIVVPLNMPLAWEATCRDGLLYEGEDEQFSARIHELFTWYFTLSRVSRLSCDGSNGNGHGAASLGILIGTYWQWRIFNIGTLTILALRESVSLRKLPKSTVCSMRWKPRVLFDEQPVSMRRKPPSMRWLSGYLRVVIRVLGSTRLSEVLPW